MTERLKVWIGVAIAAIVVVGAALAIVLVVGIPGDDSDTDTTAVAITAVDTVPATQPEPPPTTIPRPTCERRTIDIQGLTVRAEPKVASRADDQLEEGRPVCVMLTSKDGRWIYIRYADPGIDPADACMSEPSPCPLGWVSKRYTVAAPGEDPLATTTVTPA